MHDPVANGGKKPTSTSVLVKRILDEFEGVPIEPVMRKYWNETAGENSNHQISIS